MKADVAVIGTGVMGSNLARNLARQSGHRVAIYDRDVERAQKLAADFPEADFIVASDPADLAGKLAEPRVAILMVNAGRATDSAIGDLAEAFAPGDIIVDGGNSHFQDTIDRGVRLEGTGTEFAGVGISGGEVGALLGPSLMVGGSETAWQRLRPLLEPIAAKAGDEACVDHIGTDGAGHFVKMVHNGIEYGMMQSFAEGYEIMTASGIVEDVPGTFESWREGTVVRSWLLDLLSRALEEDPELAELRGYAQDSGEGRWTVQAAVDHAVPAPAITASLYARFASRQDDSPAMKVVAALRKQFGGHSVTRSAPDPGDSAAG